jgi:hypothetical protein
MINPVNKIKKIYDFYIQNIKTTMEKLAIYIKRRHVNWVFLLPILKYIHSKPNTILFAIAIISFIFATFVLGLIYVFLLFDSFIISLLVLHGIKNNSRQVSKNILSLFVLHFNPLGSIITLIIVLLLYSNVSRFISKLIIKLFESVTMFVFSFVPFISLMYPDTREIRNDKPGDSTSFSTEKTDLISSNSTNSTNSTN